MPEPDLLTKETALEMAWNLWRETAHLSSPTETVLHHARALVEREIAVLEMCVNTHCYHCREGHPLYKSESQILYHEGNKLSICDAQFEQRSLAAARAVLEELT